MISENTIAQIKALRFVQTVYQGDHSQFKHTEIDPILNRSNGLTVAKISTLYAYWHYFKGVPFSQAKALDEHQSQFLSDYAELFGENSNFEQAVEKMFLKVFNS